MRAACILFPTFISIAGAGGLIRNRMSCLVEVKSRMIPQRFQSAVPAMSQMKPQGVQQWRPKVKVQCVPDAGAVELKPAPLPEDVPAAVIEEAKKVLEKVSSSLEVNQVVVQSMKKQRGRLKRKIETETKTTLSISKQNTGYCVVVEGVTDAAVEQATKRLQSLLEKAETKGDTTKTQERVVSAAKAQTSQTSQWMPKAVRGMHTSAGAEKLKEVIPVKEQVDDVEKVSEAIQVDKKLLRLIKGNKNQVKERIEKDTNTIITIGSPVVVEGSSEESVQKALDEIQRIIEEGVNDWKFQYSHFISLPLSLHPKLVKQLEKFQEEVLVAHGIPLTEETAEATGEPTETGAQPAQVKPNSEAAEEEQQPVSVATSMEVELDSQESDRSEQHDQTQEAVDDVFKSTVMISLGMPVEEKLENDASENFEEPEQVIEAEKVVENKAENTEAGQEPELANETEEVIEALFSEKVEVLKPVEDEAEKTVDVCDAVKAEREDDAEKNGAEGTTEGLTEGGAEKYEPLAEVSFSTKKTGASGIEKSIFIRPTRFHLTVLMLKLWNEERVEKAREVLQSCLPKVVEALDNKPVSVSLTGLEIMKGSPKNTRVLYAKVKDFDDENRLSRACQVIIDEFVEAGLVLDKDQEQALKLHATLMNTSHRRSKSKFKNKGFDATKILERFGDEVWGDYQVLEAHLSERFKYDENDYYHCCGSISLPRSGDQK